jgi:site-specific DNA-methyltransferase (cytosine-N4-specific)
MSTRLIIGDCRAVLPTLEAGSVQCVVTSPPYYGLRDYGTGEWAGGDPDCDHAQEPPRYNGPKQFSAQVSGHASKAEKHGRKVCGKCGAHRIDSQIGLEATPAEYVAAIVGVFREVWRVLRDDGTCWLNLGDSYATGTTAPRKATKIEGPDVPASWADRSQPERVGTPPGFKTKDLMGMPWRVAFALQDDGWYLRRDIIWSKPNPMPESVTDRPTTAHEYVFLLTKRPKYFYDAEAVREEGTIPAGTPSLAAITEASCGCIPFILSESSSNSWLSVFILLSVPTMLIPASCFQTTRIP